MLQAFTKRLCLLTVMLLLSVVNALAQVAKIGDTEYATLQAAFDAVPADGTPTTITMLADAQVSSSITINANQSVVLDLNGKTITSTAVLFNSDGNLTIKDSGENGAIDVTANMIINSTGKEIKIEGGNLSVHSTTSAIIYGVQIRYGASFEMTGGKITITAASTSKLNYCVYNSGNGSVTISGGELVGEATGANYVLNITGSGTTTITGGTFSGTYSGDYADPKIRRAAPTVIYNSNSSATISISGGYFKAIGKKSLDLVGNFIYGKASVSGGYFGGTYYKDVDPSQMAEGYELISLTDTEPDPTDAAAFEDGYHLKATAAAPKVAQIGSTKYATLADAFAAATSGQTITLLADCETGSSYTISAPLKIANTGTTLDLNGKTLTVNNNFSFCVTADDVTIKNGTIASAENTAKATKLNSYILVIGGVAKDATISGVTIENVTTQGGISVGGSSDAAVKGIAKNTVIKDCNVLSGDYYAVCSQNESTVTINGGQYTANTASSYSKVLQASFKGDDGPEGTISVVAGTFTGAIAASNQNLISITGGTYSVDPTAYVAEGYKAVNNGDGTWTVSQAAVAQIGNVKYASLEEAFAAAQDGQTIKLLANCSGNGIIVPQGKFATGLTVDFAKFTYTVDGSTLAGSAGTKTQAFQLLKDNKITFKNGAIVGNTADVKMLIQNYSDLILDGMTLDATQGTNSVNYVLSTNNGKTVINNTTITAKANGKAFDVDSGWGNYESNSVELMGGKSVINGDIEVAFEGKTAGTPSVLKLTVGTLNGNIVMGTGANKCTVIKGAYFVAAAPAGYEWKDNGNDTRILKAIEYINDVTDESGETVVATETATITNGEATITNVEIAQEGVKNVTVSAAINSADVTEIAEGAFASLAESAVQTIDLSSTKVALEGERSVNPVLKDIPATALIYLPSSSNKVTGTNVVIKDAENKYTCNDFLMLDEQDYSVPTPFTATTATLSRSFTAGLHCTVCLPYDVPKENINGSIYRYTAFKAATTTIEMTQDIDGLDANVPYIFVPNSGTSSISASNIEVKMETPQTTEGNFTFKGVFEEKRFTGEEYSAGIYGYAGENWQGLSQGAFYKLAQTAYVPAMRAYLVSNSVAGAPSINGAQAAQSLPTKIQVVLKNADGETTDILHFDMETAEDDTPVYNLNGQRVNNAEKGVYIKNGKKVIIK